MMETDMGLLEANNRLLEKRKAMASRTRLTSNAMSKFETPKCNHGIHLGQACTQCEEENKKQAEAERCVKAEKAEKEREEEEKARKDFLEKKKQNPQEWMKGVPAKFREASFDNFRGGDIIKKKCLEFISAYNRDIRIYEGVNASFDKGLLSYPGSIVFTGTTGCGKCYGKGTGILMIDGSFKKVEDIVVGDVLMGDDSNPRNVLSLGRGREELYEIKTTNGDKLTVNKSHILILRDTRKSAGNKVTTLSVGEYLTKSKTFKHCNKLYRVPVEFKEQDTFIDPYFMGLWIGDGDKTNPRIITKDEEIIQYLEGYSKELGLTLKKYAYRDRCPSYSITGKRGGNTVDNFSLQQELRKAGVIGKEKHIPEIFKINSRGKRLRLLAGIIDSDGHLASGLHYEITVSEKRLAEDIVFLARSLGFRSNIREKKATIREINYSSIVYRVPIIGDCSIIPVMIKRKKAPKRTINKNPLVTGFSIKPVGCGNYFGFTLDGNHLHLLDSFIVVHNTHLAVSLWRELVLESRSREVFFITVPELLLEIRATFGQKKSFDSWEKSDPNQTEEQVIDKYSKVELLILDDLGSEKTSDFTIQSLYLIIDRRNRELRPTIITTNLSLQEIEDNLGARIASRLADMTIIKINMPDYRKGRK